MRDGPGRPPDPLETSARACVRIRDCSGREEDRTTAPPAPSHDLDDADGQPEEGGWLTGSVRLEELGDLLEQLGLDETEQNPQAIEEANDEVDGLTQGWRAPVETSIPTILIVDRDPESRRLLTEAVARSGFAVLAFESPLQARAALDEPVAARGESADEHDPLELALAVIELELENEHGLKLAAAVRRFHPDAGVIVAANEGSETLAVDALRLGVDDYLSRPYDAEEARAAASRALARRAARRISRTRLLALKAWNQKLEKLAVLDPLTNLYNRRYLDARLDGELRRVARNPRPLAVALIDLDGFKGLNDARGHRAGDRFLARVGRALRQRCRVSDVACRYGGDEFAVILPETNAAGARAAAEAIREALKITLPPQRREGAAESSEPDGERTITASIGIAVTPACGKTAAELISAADDALYRAKRAGRDQVVLAGALPGHARVGKARPNTPPPSADEAKTPSDAA